MIPEAARFFFESDSYAHVVTLGDDGAPHITMAWVGLEGDDILIATLHDQRKLRNLRKDPRVAISMQGTKLNEWGLLEYLVVHGTAEITQGGAPELLQEYAKRYLGPDVKFPAMPDPPPGYVTRIRVDQVKGMGSWAE